MTYNIHHGAGMDGRVDLERIAAVIRAAKPDFVALQEVDNGTKRAAGADQANELARLTGMHGTFGAAMPYEAGQYGDAVLSRQPILKSRVVPLPWTKGNQHEPRCAVSARVDVAGAGMVEFISTHWDHTRDPSDRPAQAEALNAAWHDADASTIVAGDFNCQVGSEALATIGREWTLISGGDPAAPTCCGTTPKVNIDHVFVKSSPRWRVVEHHVVDEAMASDHRPVVVTLELRAK
jgi:endonuclease/exonuclease/phosphatase family metal-dependent hydrolase